MSALPTRLRLIALFGAWALPVAAAPAAAEAARNFRTSVEPLLAKYCLDCHGGGIRKGGVALDGLVVARGLGA